MCTSWREEKNKDRLNSDSQLTDSETWIGTVISNGEKSLIGMCSKNAGNKIRVIEPQHVKWTKSAKHAEKISEVIMNNYGYEGYEFASYVMKKDKENLKKRYEEIIKFLMKEICKEVVEDNYTKRRVNKYALIYLTGELYMEMIQQDISLSGVVNMFIDIEKKSMKERNFERSALDYISMYIDIHASKFKSADRDPKGEVWGEIKEKETYTEIAINPLKFEEILKEGGYEDKDVVLNNFKESRILSCDKDRYTRKRKMKSGAYGRFIVLKIKK